MKSMLRTVLLLLACAAGAAEARQIELRDPAPQRIFDASGQPASSENLRQAAIRGAQSRGWRVLAVEGQRVSLEIVVRERHTLQVDVIVSDGEYRVVYRDSENMEYEEEDGERLIHPNFARWVAYLQQSINREVQ